MKRIYRDDLYSTGWVIGMMFSKDLRKVVLIKKKRSIHKGKLNAPGGKIEPGESHRSAVSREFREETGVFIDKWQYLGLFSPQRPKDVFIHVFYTVGNVDKCKTTTDEEIIILDPKFLGTTKHKFARGLPEWIFEARYKLQLKHNAFSKEPIIDWTGAQVTDWSKVPDLD